MKHRTLEEIKKAVERQRLMRDKWIEISLWAAALFLAMLLIGCAEKRLPVDLMAPLEDRHWCNWHFQQDPKCQPYR